MKMAKLLRRVSCAAVAATALAFLASCVTYSIHPLYDGTNSVFEPGLVGTWTNDAAKESDRVTFAFEKADANSYKLTLSDFSYNPPEVDVFSVFLVKLNGRLFYDAEQTGVMANGKERFIRYMPSSHLIGRVSLAGDTLRYGPLDEGWLKEGFKSGKIKLAHEILDNKEDDVMLTVSTAELQKFVLEHADDDKAFGQSDALHRVK